MSWPFDCSVIVLTATPPSALTATFALVFTA